MQRFVAACCHINRGIYTPRAGTERHSLVQKAEYGVDLVSIETTPVGSFTIVLRYSTGNRDES